MSMREDTLIALMIVKELLGEFVSGRSQGNDVFFGRGSDDLLLSVISDGLGYVKAIYYSDDAVNDNIFIIQKVAC